MRFFWSENATRPILCNGNPIQCTRVGYSLGGQWKGYYCTTDAAEINALVEACVKIRSLREITAEEFRSLTKIEPNDGWKIEEIMPEPFAVENLVPSILPERCFRDGRIIHCVERHKQKDPDARRRVATAVESWIRIYMTGEVVPCHLWRYPRSAQGLGDKRDLPYLKDVLEAGLNKSNSDADIIMFSNDDTVLHPDIATAIYGYLEKIPAVCSGRMNYNLGEIPNWKVNEKGSWGGDIGRDVFAFRKAWLKKNWDEIPDFLLGELEWDLVLSAMIRKKVGRENMSTQDWKPLPNGKGIPARERRNQKCELPPGYVWHEDHDKEWRNMDLFYSPAKRHNIHLMQRWYRENNLEHLITV